MNFIRFAHCWRIMLIISALLLVACATESGPLASGQPAGRDYDSLPEPAIGAPPVSAIQLELVAEGMRRPVYVTHAGDGRFFAAEQEGVVRVVENGVTLEQPFLDIRGRLSTDGSERGLLGLAFHPNYAENGYFYVVYTDLDGNTALDRFQVSAGDPNRADPDSQLQIMFVEQPYGNHNGGQLRFGPAGYFYAGFGDGGAVGDPFDNAQNPETVLGSLLRLDLDSGEPYTIPAGNPFTDENDDPLPTWQIGLRNPYTFSFDQLTGDLYIADVGQEGPEEINFVPAGYDGLNFGWPVWEGNQCYEAEDCPRKGFQEPVVTYAHNEGCAVIGGYVYRGQAFPALTGNYFFSDYCLGTIWALRYNAEGWQRNVVYDMGTSVSSFIEGPDGELYVVTYREGEIWQIQEAE